MIYLNIRVLIKSYKVCELVRDLLLHHVELHYQLLVAGDPVHHRVRHVLQILRLLLAHLHLSLCCLLQLQSVLAASRYTLSAKRKALVNLFEWSLSVVEAVETAPCALVVHDIELFVEKSVEANLSLFQSLVQIFEYLLIHMAHCVLIVLL